MGKKKKKTIHVAPISHTKSVDPLLDAINCTKQALEREEIQRPATAGSGLKQASLNEFTAIQNQDITPSSESKDLESYFKEPIDDIQLEQKKEESKPEQKKDESLLQKLFKLFSWSK